MLYLSVALCNKQPGSQGIDMDKLMETSRLSDGACFAECLIRKHGFDYARDYANKYMQSMQYLAENPYHLHFWIGYGERLVKEI